MGWSNLITEDQPKFSPNLVFFLCPDFWRGNSYSAVLASRKVGADSSFQCIAYSQKASQCTREERVQG
jgi:hypothetical protein